DVHGKRRADEAITGTGESAGSRSRRATSISANGFSAGRLGRDLPEVLPNRPGGAASRTGRLGGASTIPSVAAIQESERVQRVLWGERHRTLESQAYARVDPCRPPRVP